MERQERKIVTYTQKFHPISSRYLQPLTFGNISELFNNLVEDVQFYFAFGGTPRDMRPASPIEAMQEGELEESDTKRILEELAFFNSCSPETALAYGHPDFI